MDEEEIEAWYDEQKDRITEQYRLKIDKVKNKEKLKKDYLKKIDALHKKYEQISQKTTNKNLKWFFFNHRLNMIKQKLMKPFLELKEKYGKNKKPES
jgi:hypothetical protein